MSDYLKELYQEIIFDHSKNPRYYGKVEDPCVFKESYNPLCGDRIYLSLSFADDRFLKIAFEGKSCAMCTASASLLLERFNGLSLAVAKNGLPYLWDLLTQDNLSTEAQNFLGKLMTLQEVKKYPSRVKCVTLSWHALKDLITELDQSGSV